MHIALTDQRVCALTNTLSAVRMSTYAAATGFSPLATPLDIYRWNASVSAAFFSSLHVSEVAIRNGVSGALERKYGASWPWSAGFEQTLPTQMKLELQRARHSRGVTVGATGKVVAELKFAFWCQMFTSRHDAHVWNAHLRQEFPLLPLPFTVAGARTWLYEQMEALRKFRNRIAHHEPIFAYPLAAQHTRINRVLRARCNETLKWLGQWESVTAALAARP